MFELQQKTRKKIQGLYLLSLSPQDVLFLGTQLTRSIQLSYTFLSPGDYLKIVVVNKPLYLWTKSVFPEFLKFSHVGVTTVSDYYLRRRNTAINMFDNQVVQPYVCCIIVNYLHIFLFDLLQF